MRETLYTANVSADNAHAKLISSTRNRRVVARLKRKRVSHLRRPSAEPGCPYPWDMRVSHIVCQIRT